MDVAMISEKMHRRQNSAGKLETLSRDASDEVLERNINTVFALFDVYGGTHHELGVNVSQLEHGLQAALLSEQAGDDAELITASLLHDIGHFSGENIDSVNAPHYMEHDEQHEEVGAAFLAQFFGPAVTEPVRQHVAAKRYAAMDAAYFASLSPTSRRSLELQGGAFTEEEAKAWLALPFADRFLRLRKYDELAKVEGQQTPPLSYFRKYVKEAMVAHR